MSEPEIIFEPSLDNNIVNNFYDQILDLIDDIFHMARLIPRYLERPDQTLDNLRVTESVDRGILCSSETMIKLILRRLNSKGIVRR